MTDRKTDSKLDQLIENLVGFLETKSEIIKLEFREEVTKVLSKLIAWLIITILVSLFLLFSSVALGNYLNYRWNSPYLGFVALGGVFFILWMVMLLLKQLPWYHRIIGYFTDSILSGTEDKHETSTED